MSVLKEGAFDEDSADDGTPEPKSMTALSILESLAPTQAPAEAAAPVDGLSVDAESVESVADSAEGSPVEDDVFELEGLDGVRTVTILLLLFARLILESRRKKEPRPQRTS